MTNKRNLTYNEIEKLADGIRRWCIYDTGRGGYGFYDVEADEKGNGETFYTVRRRDGSVKCIIKDFTIEIWAEEADGTIFYYEDEKVTDRWLSKFDRVITFKNHDSKVKEKYITHDGIRVYYRNGEVKDYRFDDEEA